MKKLLNKLSVLAVATIASAAFLQAEEPSKPNVIIFFTDDMGYADISPYGAKEGLTPHLAKLADEGVVLTDFYSAYASCSCSRAALLTGCYPLRVGMQKNFWPNSKTGLNPKEVTIADMLKDAGYKTAMVGKWHLGSKREFMPNAQGFDYFYGFPYSHDMWSHHPLNKKYKFGDLPLYENENVINAKVTPDEQRDLTARLSAKAINFIRENKDSPFFVYYAQPFPHVPIYASEKFEGLTGDGAYADNIAELDHGVGQVMAVLEELKLKDNTLIIFTSDNGPWLQYGDHAGSAGPFRSGKGTVFEGGYRVPGIISWPAKIGKGESDMICGTIDLLPTIAEAAGARLPVAKIDGKSLIAPLTSGEYQSPHEFLFYNTGAVRRGKWKLVLPGTESVVVNPGKGGMQGDSNKVPHGLLLFDLEADQGETTNVAEKHPEVAAKLKAVLTKHIKELERNRRSLGGVKGSKKNKKKK